MREVLIVESLIGHERIGVDRALGFHVTANLRLQVMLAASGNHVRMDLAAALQNANDSSLVFHAAFSDDALAPFGVHEASRTADEGFVYLDFATGTAEFHKALLMQ